MMKTPENEKIVNDPFDYWVKFLSRDECCVLYVIMMKNIMPSLSQVNVDTEYLMKKTRLSHESMKKCITSLQEKDLINTNLDLVEPK